MSLHRVEQELEDRATLLGAGGDHCPDTLAPPTAFLAGRPLRDMPVDHHEMNRLFRQVVRRVDARRGDEAEVRFSGPPNKINRMFAEPRFLANSWGRCA